MAFAAVALLAGCAEESGGAPGRTSAPSSEPAANALPHSGAPKVENPIDTAAFEAEPCSVATPRQLSAAGLEFKPAEPDPEQSTGSDCLWRFSATGYGLVGGTFFGLHDQGLSALYARRSSYGLFEEIPPIGGYPALVWNTSDHRKEGFCTISIGLRDDQTYDVAASLGGDNPDKTTSCEVARTVAEIAVETIKKGGA